MNRSIKHLSIPIKYNYSELILKYNKNYEIFNNTIANSATEKIMLYCNLDNKYECIIIYNILNFLSRNSYQIQIK